MIEVSFEGGAQRSAAASGAYQYDTGQRLRMHGLPSPAELAGADEFLSGDMATMQVHFGMKGDSQTQARLALWDEGSGCWLSAIPDEYLQTAESVYAYIYVSHGQDEAGNGRTKTMYELTFRPIARPAPNNVATGEQWEAWAVKRAEMEMAIAAMDAACAGTLEAAQRTQAAAEAVKDAAQQAMQAGESAQSEAQRLAQTQSRWEGMALRATRLPSGAQATAQIAGRMITLGLPQGKPGEKGETGDAGPADIALDMKDGVLTITPRG